MPLSASLAKRRVLLTGASRGIGAAIARRLLEAGAAVALIARQAEQLRALAGLGRGHVLPADLAAARNLPELVGRAASAMGGLDVVINCAGVVRYQALPQVRSPDLEAQLRLNLTVPFEICQAAVPYLLVDGGDLIQIASTLGLRPVPQVAAYAASKAALISLTRSYALELGPKGIRANAVAPGVIDTDMVRALRPSADGAEALDVDAQLRQLAALHPVGRLGAPEEVAEAVVYLLSNPFVNGTVLTVDGGLSLT